MVQQEASVRWALILTLAALGLVRPLLSILGAYGSIEMPWGARSSDDPYLSDLGGRRGGWARP